MVNNFTTNAPSILMIDKYSYLRNPHSTLIFFLRYNTAVGSVSVTITEIHHVYGHQVTCMASNTQRVAYALIMNYGWVKGFDGVSLY